MVESQSKTTTDHDEIKKWAEERGGRPTVVHGTESDDSGLLRIDFAEKDEKLDEISWEDFFRIFDENDLEFLYQDKTKSGDTSRFFKFVRNDN